MLDQKKIHTKLNRDGVCIINNFLSEKKCDHYVGLLKDILKKRIKKKK